MSNIIRTVLLLAMLLADLGLAASSEAQTSATPPKRASSSPRSSRAGTPSATAPTASRDGPACITGRSGGSTL